jgi:hypothetical protein
MIIKYLGEDYLLELSNQFQSNSALPDSAWVEDYFGRTPFLSPVSQLTISN